MLERTLLKRILGEVGRLKNATKKRSAEWALLLLERVLNWNSEIHHSFNVRFIICLKG